MRRNAILITILLGIEAGVVFIIPGEKYITRAPIIVIIITIVMDLIRNRSVYRFILLSICICHASAELNIETMQSISGMRASRKGSELATIERSPTVRRSRAYKRGYNVRRGSEDYREDYQNDDYHNNDANDDNDDDHEHDHVKAMSQPKVDYWAGYYDFLINEGSYKFWAVFQLATAALLIYSGFAALYYAKVNPPTTDDFDDIFRRRRRRRRRRYALPSTARDRPFAGLDTVTFQRIIEAADKADNKRTR